VLNPGSVNVTVYVPALRSMMRYEPRPSVTADRVRSIKAGPAASTVTPGSTAPEESVTTPVMDGRIDCADAHAGTSATHSARTQGLAYPCDLETILTISLPPRRNALTNLLEQYLAFRFCARPTGIVATPGHGPVVDEDVVFLPAATQRWPEPGGIVSHCVLWPASTASRNLKKAGNEQPESCTMSRAVEPLGSVVKIMDLIPLVSG
jgi:hypothetical protein